MVIHIYVQLPNYIILSQQLTKLCYLNRDKPTLYNVQILRLRYWLYCSIYYENKKQGTSLKATSNSPDLNPLDYHVWGAMLERYHKLQPKPKTIAELKAALQSIWDDMPQAPINKAIKNFTKRLKACVQANGGHFEHLM